MRVGFIGLGSQGGPMARRIVEAGFETTLWARRPSTVEPYADTAARVAASPAELAAASDLVCLCVVADADVDEVATEVLNGLAPGGIIAVHSTVHPDTCRRLAERAAAQGVSVIDAPVSGGGGAAAEGRLLVMSGGDESTVERCRPVFATYSDRIVHLGELGAGQVTKLLNNVLFTAHLGTAAGVLALGRALGVDPVRLAEVVTQGSGNSFALSRVHDAGGTLQRIAAHAGPVLAKDVRLVGQLADAAGALPGILQLAADDALRAMGQGAAPA
jgi:3-hydroxyisobutyrate dehydrogenase-like beta-hydroxyacid dehydrogenase